MDKLNHYRSLLKDLFTQYAAPTINKDDETEEQLIFDEVHDHYQVVALGWQGKSRIYFTLLHLDIKKGKIWLQENATEYNIFDDLMKQGVPASDLVLGFISPTSRKFSDFAVF